MFGANYFSSIYFGEQYFSVNFPITVSLSDTLGLTDSLSRTVSFLRSIVDSEGITDVVSKMSSHNISLGDLESITDSLSRMLQMGNITVSSASVDVIRPLGMATAIKAKNIIDTYMPLLSKLEQR